MKLKNPKKKVPPKKKAPRKVQPKKQPTISNRIVIVNSNGTGAAKETAQAPSFYREPLYLDQSGVIPKMIVLKGEEEPQKVSQNTALPAQPVISSQQQQMIAQNAFSHGSVSGTLTGLASSGLSPFQGLPAPKLEMLGYQEPKSLFGNIMFDNKETPRVSVVEKEKRKPYTKSEKQKAKEEKKRLEKEQTPKKSRGRTKKSEYSDEDFPLVSD